MKNWWNKNWRWLFWLSLPICMIVCAIWATSSYFTEDNLITGMFKIGPMLWLILWLAVLLVWMLLHMGDGPDGGSSSSGDWSIPAPSKQTQRMLKRNMRRRWF